MTTFVDYNQIAIDVASLIGINVTSFQRVGADVDDREFHHANMPLCSVRLATADPVNTSQQTYYVGVQLELEIAAFDLSSRREASKILLQQLDKTQQALRANPHYGAVWDALQLGPVEFLSAEDKESGAFVAGCLARVTISAYTG